MDTFSLIKMRKVKGQMEGVSVAETERRVSCAMSPLTTHTGYVLCSTAFMATNQLLVYSQFRRTFKGIGWLF